MREDGSEVPEPEIVERDFSLMAQAGLNAIRMYTIPPRWLLDCALRHGLLVMVGLPWEQHVAFLDDPNRCRDVERRLREGVRSCAGHPAVLAFTVGNELPAPIVRWHGRRRIERFLSRLYRAVKSEDPDSLVSYVNYPTTEYLHLPFLDFVTFNVYLESPDRYAAYLSRLQNLAGDRPLVMAEIGLDSRRHGECKQAETLDWQVRSAFAAGCAGAFVFAWTDEWHRGGHDVTDWDFGLTDRQRQPKPALQAVATAFSQSPFGADQTWPRISVVVCTHNGERTLRECLTHLSQLRYPDYEVIVVNDGSTDKTALVAGEFGFRLINIANQGLSAARNVGMQASSGEIVAYIDDDAYPDPDWLSYFALTFQTSKHVAVGGPNLPPPGDGPIADCVANSPGGPIHVLLSDQEAEHIPGCNMAFRRDTLIAVGGFDGQFRAAGDDVDICWRIHEQGMTIGYSPAALVWHHRRNSVRTYLRQQIGYGKAEALLERKWSEKYNVVGHLAWTGRLYGKGFSRDLGRWRSRVYQGVWGSAPFQWMYEPTPSLIYSLPLMPEWFLVVAGLAATSALGFSWTPLLLAVPVFLVAFGIILTQAILSGARASFTPAHHASWQSVPMRFLVAWLHLVQPAARLYGRIKVGLTPWRWSRRLPMQRSIPWTYQIAIWSEQWMAPQAWLISVESILRSLGGPTRPGGDFDRWDLEIRGGLFGAARILRVVEEHGSGKQLVRIRLWPRCSLSGLGLLSVVGSLAIVAGFDGAWLAAGALGVFAILTALQVFRECAAAISAATIAIQQLTSSDSAAKIMLVSGIRS